MEEPDPTMPFLIIFLLIFIVIILGMYFDYRKVTINQMKAGYENFKYHANVFCGENYWFENVTKDFWITCENLKNKSDTKLYPIHIRGWDYAGSSNK